MYFTPKALRRLMLVLALAWFGPASLHAELPNGILTTLLTPLDEEGNIQENIARAQVDDLVQNKVNGIVLFGTIGEGVQAPADDIVQLARVVVQHSRGRLPVIVGVQQATPDAAFDLAVRLKDVGVDALQFMPMASYDMTWSQRLELFRRLDQLDIALIYYNYPKISGVELEDDHLDALFRLKNVRGIKNSLADRDLIARHVAIGNEHGKKVYGGLDFRFTDFLRLGTAGSIGPMGLFDPETMRGIYHNPDSEVAEALQCELFDFIYLFTDLTLPNGAFEWMFCSNPLRGTFKDFALKPGDKSQHARLKAMLREQGIPIQSHVYPPLPALTAKDRKQIERVQAANQ